MDCIYTYITLRSHSPLHLHLHSHLQLQLHYIHEIHGIHPNAMFLKCFLNHLLGYLQVVGNGFPFTVLESASELVHWSQFQWFLIIFRITMAKNWEHTITNQCCSEPVSVFLS